MTGTDVAMLALTLAGFALVAMLPYAAFRLVELVDDALDARRSASAGRPATVSLHPSRAAARRPAQAADRIAAPGTATAPTRTSSAPRARV